VNLFRVRKTVRSLKRYREILNILLKYGFEDVLARLRLESIARNSRRLFRRQRPPLLRKSRPERIRLALEELGPTFIKFGQMLSTRIEVIPREYIRELRKLQDSVAPFPTSQARAIVERELRRPVDSVFRKFQDVPLAAASIAQVHRAETLDGEKVVVKIQRPGIEAKIKKDAEILLDLARLVERRIPESRLYDPVVKVQEFGRWIRQELDFLQEGRNVERFRRNFEGDETVRIPKVFWDLTTSRVLVLEYAEGIPVQNLEALDRAGLDRKRIALNGARTILKMIFEHGFFHGDPHPGNLLAGENNVIIPLDYGLMGHLDDDTVNLLAGLAEGVLLKDTERIARIFLAMGMVDGDADLRAFRSDISDLLDRYDNARISRIRVETLVGEAVGLVSAYRIRLPRNLILMGKSLAVVESVGLGLDPEFDIIPVARPFFRRFVRRQASPKRMLRNAAHRLDDYRDLASTLPDALRQILNKVQKDEFGINFRHQGLDHLIRELDKSTNRISFSLIIAALIIASSLIIQANLGPRLLGISAFGLVGFLFAALLGLWLVVAIMRSGRL
jgi:ubiquinone biosynthesis protein